MKSKRWIIGILIVVLLCAAGYFGTEYYRYQKEMSHPQPNIINIRSICELATLECYYHNVAKSQKTAEGGLGNVFKKDRDFWIEYDGTVKLGIDMTQVKMDIAADDSNAITITLPPAKVLDVTINSASYNEESYVASEDNWISSNKITAEDATQAIAEAQEKMIQTAGENRVMLLNAQDRAKMLIENYITQIGDAFNTGYTINWVYLE